ncbi:zinc finger ZZ-type and EF-hand domain-containing protein 1 [Patella vulgata]|uniref:zinc finger ZZ-type and EF-hand domain-containing protein 1 n=1 Tax=Patella vulgata TaxID=6465 RepID=UPI0021808948|nr:zinc finger ZZ-type and EF-hand domain-containing protein 1 [Patella vulgata]
MGNSNSSSDTEEDPRGDVNEDDDAYSDNELDAGTKEEVVSADLNNLFDPQTLRTLAAKIREEVPSNVTQQHHNAIVRWLCDRPETQETVTLAQFTDMLVSKGASKIEARRVFQEFDMDGSGVADITTILDAVQSYSSGSVQGEIGKSIRMLQACTLTPGFVDVYTGDKNPIHNHGERILKYLLRNRAESRSLPFPCLNGFNNTSSMRQSVLKSTFNHLKNSVAGGDTEEQELAEGEELRPITKCYSGIEVSTNTSDAYRLTNGDPNTFWQSDGTARSHWIRLRMKSNAVLKLLSINVASSDQSYMPELVTVSTGRNPRSLREIKEIRIPSNTVGEFVLLKNVKLHYPVVQINIKRCHSDGCDTRIHALKAVAYRVVKEPGVSVLDASATWYLQVLASLVGATLPQAPQLRTHIINHTRTALEHMPPLSLCPASSDRPQFLSRHVLRELDSFILEMSINEGNTQAEGLHLLLSLNLARGHVARLIQILKYFYEQPNISLKCASLLASALEAKNSCWEKLGSVVPMTVLGCHGGKENMTSLENVINHTSEGTKHVFYTEEGKTRTDLFFKCKDYVQFTKFRIKIPPGGKGPRRGLIFVYNHTGEFDYDEEVTKFSKYDNWHELTYKFSVNIRSAGVGGKSDNPVSYFHFDDDCDEMDVPVSWYPAGKTVLVKLFEPRQESASKLGLVSIKFFGFVRKLPNLEDDKMSLPTLNPEKQPNCTSLEIVQIVITFLVDLSLDQVKKKGKISRGDFLDFQGVDLETIWTLYKLFKDSDDAGWKTCSLKILKLLHGLTPVMIPLSDSAKVVSDEVFHYLCNVIDSTEIDKTSQTYLLSEQLIVDGASLFFPNKEMKRKKLFTMMNNVDNLTTAPSVALVFQSLCQFFSSVDPQGLLDLPKVPTQSFNVTSVLDVMKTLIVVASQEFTFTSVEESTNEQLTYLIQLTGSLQSSLLAWCSKLLNEEDEAMRKVAMDMTTQYACHVATRAVEVMETLISRTPAHLVKMSSTLQPPFLSSIVRQLVLILNFLSPKLDSKSHVMLLQSWKPLLVQLETIAVKIPDVFPKMSCDKWAESKTDDIILRTWELESNHNYENNSHISQTFCCPGATSFVVDFDPRSETERRYDYLEFTDGKGISRKFDQKVGNPKWPKQVVFSGPNLHFLFRSDGSNTEWGYKFLVTAKGTPDAPLSWPYDLELGLAKLFGGFCGLVLSSNPVVPKNSLQNVTDVDDSTDQEVLRSELWTSLFRGGYMVGKLQHSLSLKVATDESIHLLEFFTEIETNKSPLSIDFLKKCRQQRSNVGKVGGEDVDVAVVSVFLALLWHTQQLREDLERYLKNKGEMSVSEGIVQAYNTAESIRMSLVSQRQKVKANEGEMSLEEDPVSVCKKKAEFLLKFAGLTKVQLKADMRNKPSKLSLKKIGNKKNEMPLIRSEVYEKFPSFRLVMEFIQDLAWTTERVQQMLKERSQYASAVCEVYHFASEIIQILTEQHLFQITLVLFFQELFSHQDNFPLHYADGLEGCGLEKESTVRRAYYALIRKLTNTFQNNQDHAVDSQVIPAYRYIQACLLHLLDTQWKPYDLTFVSEIKLPELFMKIAKETVKMRNCTMGEEEEVEELRGYKLCMSWLEECTKGFSDWYKEKEDASKDQKKEIQMFVARFCDLLDVEINCDGCGNTLPGRRYRCLQCVDMDLCTTCFSGGVKPEGDHKDDHDIVHLVFKCNKCQGFIIGTRIHCDICEDFDLCLGCHSNQKFPAEHLESHAVTRIPPVRLKTLLTSDSLTQAYIHQHVWLLFTSLSLILGEIIRNDTSHVSSDSDYIRLSAQLQNQCITLCTDCLEKVPDDADDGSKHLLQEGTENLETRQEEAFAFHSQERIMGLLGAMIPLENKIPIQGVTYNFTTKDFLHLLYKVARGDRNHELNTQHLGMGLLGRLLTKSSTEVSDEAVLTVVPSKTSKPTAPSGQETVNYLFNFGASCLEKSGIEWLCSF